ncbi:MAG: hypothetical protein KTR31_18335 [Myxococcales bacterium]|nr:hypothetical protein [Myxococcales bacterium]
MLHPLALAATGVMLLNDHVLKQACAGLVTGKLSDVTGLVVLPLTLFSLAELLLGRCLGVRWLVAAVGVSVTGFVLVELWPPATALWCWSWGLLQWPAHAVLTGGWPPVRPVAAVSDWSDLVTLPAVAICGMIWARMRG